MFRNKESWYSVPRNRKQSEKNENVGDHEKQNESPNKTVKYRNKNLKYYLGQCGKITLNIVTVLVMVFLLGYIRFRGNKNASTGMLNSEKFWGTYRSNLYFGLKTRSPTSPVVGLMWLGQSGNLAIRHSCSQDDRLPKYGWLKHDGINFGIQDIVERHFNLTTSFVKQPGGEHGGDWTARISAIPKDVNRPVLVSLMFYVALDGQGTLNPNIAKTRMEGISGQSLELGNFKLSFPKARKGLRIKYNHLISYAPRLDKLKDLLQNSLRTDFYDKGRTIPFLTLGGRLLPRDSPAPNFMVHQVTAQLPLEMEVVFESGSNYDRTDSLQGEIYTHKLEKFSKTFDNKGTLQDSKRRDL